MWIPKWCQKIGAICHRNEAAKPSPAEVNRLLVERAAKRRMDAIVAESSRLRAESDGWARLGNVEHLEAIEERLVALNAEAKEIVSCELRVRNGGKAE